MNAENSHRAYSGSVSLTEDEAITPPMTVSRHLSAATTTYTAVIARPQGGTPDFKWREWWRDFFGYENLASIFFVWLDLSGD